MRKVLVSTYINNYKYSEKAATLLQLNVDTALVEWPGGTISKVNITDICFIKPSEWE